jgi:hypothetical protein
MMSVTTQCAIPASNANGFQTLKGEHQVRYDDGMTPSQTITDGTEPNRKLTAKCPSAAGTRREVRVRVPLVGEEPRLRFHGVRAQVKLRKPRCAAMVC